MRQIALLALLLAFAAAVYGQENILEKGLEGRSAADVISRRYVTPLRLVALPGELTAGVENPEALLRNFDGQLTTGTPDVCRLSTRDGRSASVLLDFGKELCGGIALSAAIRADQRALKVRIRLGESVSEAMSDVGGDAPMASATNEHSLRDFTLGVPWLGNVEAGNSGFRFVRIDLVEPDAELNLKAVRAILRYRDVPYLGSFRCDDERLNRIWETGAYTVHLNMQEYLWDGVKRDRLVWLGDMHPEVMTVQSVFGGNEVVRRSLDHVRDNTPLPGWMNWIAAYSMWWVIIHRDLYMYEGDLNYLREQQEYMRALLRVLASQMDGDRENLQGGQRLLDWPTSQMPDVIHAGYQALMVMAMEAGAEIGGWLGDRQMQSECHGALRRLRRHVPDHLRNKQAAAMLVLAGLADPGKVCRTVIARGGAEGRPSTDITCSRRWPKAAFTTRLCRSSPIIGVRCSTWGPRLSGKTSITRMRPVRHVSTSRFRPGNSTSMPSRAPIATRGCATAFATAGHRAPLPGFRGTCWASCRSNRAASPWRCAPTWDT